MQTTAGSHTITVMSGPRPLKPGDLIWNSDFLFGTSVMSVSGITFPQTVTLNSITLTAYVNASASHNPGKLWVIPEGVKRRVGGAMRDSVVSYWGVDLDLICHAGTTPLTGCNNAYDNHNFLTASLVGRLTRGDNTGVSLSVNDVYAHNKISDVVEAGTLGSTYISTGTNSEEEGSSLYGVLVLCETQNYSNFIGTYLAGQDKGPCMGLDTNGNTAIAVPASEVASPSELFIGSIYGFGNISAQSFFGNWTFAAANSATMTTTATSPAGQNVISVPLDKVFYRGIAITDLTNSVIPANTTVTDFTTAGAVISNNLTGPVQVGDKIQFINTESRGGPCS